MLCMGWAVLFWPHQMKNLRSERANTLPKGTSYISGRAQKMSLLTGLWITCEPCSVALGNVNE